MAVLAVTINWTEVLIVGVPSYIAALGAAVAAVIAAINRRSLKTPSGQSIGQQVENGLHTSLATNYQLRSVSGAVSAPPSPEAEHESAKVPGLNERLK